MSINTAQFALEELERMQEKMDNSSGDHFSNQPWTNSEPRVDRGRGRRIEKTQHEARERNLCPACGAYKWEAFEVEGKPRLKCTKCQYIHSVPSRREMREWGQFNQDKDYKASESKKKAKVNFLQYHELMGGFEEFIK